MVVEKGQEAGGWEGSGTGWNRPSKFNRQWFLGQVDKKINSSAQSPYLCLPFLQTVSDLL